MTSAGRTAQPGDATAPGSSSDMAAAAASSTGARDSRSQSDRACTGPSTTPPSSRRAEQLEQVKPSKGIVGQGRQSPPQGGKGLRSLRGDRATRRARIQGAGSRPSISRARVKAASAPAASSRSARARLRCSRGRRRRQGVPPSSLMPARGPRGSRHRQLHWR